jgi:hypothetical protein
MQGRVLEYLKKDRPRCDSLTWPEGANEAKLSVCGV